MTRMLIAGVGNVFLGDDGFGVEVIRRIPAQDLPGWVRMVDYGIRGMHLAYDIAGGGYDVTVLVDATSRGDAPGTIYVVELDKAIGADSSLLDAHGMQPDVVLGLVALLGGDPGRVLLVGCEPAALDAEMRLSPAVERAVDTGVGAVLGIVGDYARRNAERIR